MAIKNIIPRKYKNWIHLQQSKWANIRYGYPAKELKIIAVTGTDGKTSVSTMIYSIMLKAGFKVGLITSVSMKFNKTSIDTGFHVTTPDPWIIPRYLRIMANAGIKWVILETTSHALDQNRLGPIQIEKAVFTNITHDHLDYHKTWLSYAHAKTKLINYLKEGGEVIYNDKAKGARIIEKKIKASKQVILKTSIDQLQAKVIEVSSEGLRFKFEIKKKLEEIFIPILGEYNIGNSLLAIKACENLVNTATVFETLKNYKTVKGRMQIVKKRIPCLVIIDFAHTSNALKNALLTVNNLRKGKIINVFGCAGLRDRQKRKFMGRISAKYSNVSIITAEDPRSENLEKINDAILVGSDRKNSRLIKRFASRKAYMKTNLTKIKEKVQENFQNKNTSIFTFDENSIKSRQDAIDLAIKLAESDDIIIITGKGHERSLCFGSTEYDWSDFDAVTNAINKRYSKK